MLPRNSAECRGASGVLSLIHDEETHAAVHRWPCASVNMALAPRHVLAEAWGRDACPRDLKRCSHTYTFVEVVARSSNFRAKYSVKLSSTAQHPPCAMSVAHGDDCPGICCAHQPDVSFLYRLASGYLALLETVAEPACQHMFVEGLVMHAKQNWHNPRRLR